MISKSRTDFALLWVNRIVGVGLIALAIPFWRLSADYPEMARLFPRTMLIVISALAAIMILRSFIPSLAPANEGEGQFSRDAFARPFAVFGVLLVLIASSSLIGFFSAMILLSAALFPILGVRKWRSYVVGCLMLLLFVYVLFVLFLHVPLTTLRPPGF